MGGLGRQGRILSSDPRARRNASRLARRFEDLGLSGALAVSDTGQIEILSGNGLSQAGDPATLVVLLSTGLEFSGGAILLSAATEAARGGVLQAGLVADVGVLTDNSGGTSGSGTIAAVGVAVTDPADTPADADALRDDLVANTIPSIETELTNLRNAVATLAAYSTTLEDKINELLAAQKTAGQMNTV